MKPGRSVPGGIIIIVGAVFTFISVTWIAFCMSIIDGAASGMMGAITDDNFSSPATRTTFVTVIGVITFVLAICGAIYAFKHNIVGGILSAVATALLVVLTAVLHCWGNVMLLLSIIFLGVGSILTFFVKKPIPEKPQPPQPGMMPPPPPPQGGWQQPPQGNNWQQPPQGGWQQPPQGGWQQPPQGNNWQQPPQQNNWQQPPQNGQGPDNPPPPNNWQPPQN